MMQAHPLAELFPMLPERELHELADDIVTFGQRVPIVLLDGMVLDGRNRLAACRFAEVEPHFTDYDGDDPLNFVLSHNLHRRHLTESQRAMIAARIATWKVGINQSTARPADLPVWKAAAMFSVSQRSVRSAQVVERDGDPEIVAAARAGSIAVSAAERISKLPKDQQRHALRNRQDRRREKPSSPLEMIRVRDGTPIGRVPWTDLSALIAENRQEIALLTGIMRHAENVDPTFLVGDVVDASVIQRLLAEVPQ